MKIKVLVKFEMPETPYGDAVIPSEITYIVDLDVVGNDMKNIDMALDQQFEIDFGTEYIITSKEIMEVE